MDAGAFSDDRVVKASEEFVRVYVDCTRVDGRRGEIHGALLKKYEVRGFPTVIFLDPGGAVLHRMCGNCDAGELLGEMAEIAEPWSPEKRLRRALPDLGDLRAWVEVRVERLGDDDIGVREQATLELDSLREALDAALRLSLQTTDPERRERVRAILRPSARSVTPAPSDEAGAAGEKPAESHNEGEE